MVSQTQLRQSATVGRTAQLRQTTQSSQIQKAAQKQRVAQLQQLRTQQTAQTAQEIAEREAKINELVAAINRSSKRVKKLGVRYLDKREIAEAKTEVARLEGELSYYEEAKKVIDEGGILASTDLDSKAKEYAIKTGTYQERKAREKYIKSKQEAKSKAKEELERLKRISSKLPVAEQVKFLERRGYKVEVKSQPAGIKLGGGTPSSTKLVGTKVYGAGQGGQFISDALSNQQTQQYSVIGAAGDEGKPVQFSFGSAAFESGKRLLKKVFTGKGSLDEVFLPLDIAQTPPTEEQVVIGEKGNIILSGRQFTERQKEIIEQSGFAVKTKGEIIKEERKAAESTLLSEQKRLQEQVNIGSISIKEAQTQLNIKREKVQAEFTPIELKERRSPIRDIAELPLYSTPLGAFVVTKKEMQEAPLMLIDTEAIKSGKATIGSQLSIKTTPKQVIATGIGVLGGFGLLKKASAEATEVRIQSASQSIKERPTTIYSKQFREGDEIIELGRFKAVGDSSVAYGEIITSGKIVKEGKQIIRGKATTTVTTTDYLTGRPIIVSESKIIAGFGRTFPQQMAITPSISQVASGTTSRIIITGKPARNVIDLTSPRGIKMIQRGEKPFIRMDVFTKPQGITKEWIGQQTQKIKFMDETYLFSDSGKVDMMKFRKTYNPLTKTRGKELSKFGFSIEQKGVTQVVETPKFLKKGVPTEVKILQPADIKKTPFAKTFQFGDYATGVPKSQIPVQIQPPEAVVTYSKIAEVGRGETIQVLETATDSKILGTGVMTQTNLWAGVEAPTITSERGFGAVLPILTQNQLSVTKTRTLAETLPTFSLPSKEAEESISISKTKSSLSTKPLEAIKQTVAPQLALEEATRQTQQRQFAQMSQMSDFQVRPNMEFTPRLPKSTSFVSVAKKMVQKPELFKVFVRKAGADVEFGTFGTKQTARKELFKQLSGTLRASGFIEKGGKKLKVKELGFLGAGFRPSKKDSFRVVQRKEKRLGTSGETEELQFFKKKKGKKKGGLFL